MRHVVHTIHQKERRYRLLTDSKKLNELIKKSGYKKSYIAEKVGLSTAGLYNCINNKAEFKTGQIVALCDLLNIDPTERSAIFFAVGGV